jgi:hypothetical protein
MRKRASDWCARRLRPFPRPSARKAQCESLRARSAVQSIGAREGERGAHSRRNYRGADLGFLGNARERPRRQVCQCQEAKRHSDTRHNGRPHRKNRRMKRQHDFNPRKFQVFFCYAPAQIAAVTALTARAPGELKRRRPGHGLAGSQAARPKATRG